MRGLVVTDHRLASLAGARLLKEGGNAADAAVAAAAALAVIDPYMGGLGGFGYALYYDAKGDKVQGLDYIGTAPKEARIGLYNQEKPWEDYKPSAEGPLAPLVPGSVAGWMELLERMGKRRLREVLRPAIELAKGHIVSEAQHRFYESIRCFVGALPENARVLYPGGHFPRPGQRLAQPALARTLQRLARDGRDFYEGAIARSIVVHLRARGGILSEEDLASYRPLATQPLHTSYLGHDVYSHRPGSSGMTVLYWLNLLEGFEFQGRYYGGRNAHIFLEAGKLALREDDRWNTGKPYVQVPLAQLLSKKYARAQRANIGELARYYSPVTALERMGACTTHLCACDAEGNVVAMTETQMYGLDRVGLIGELGFSLNGGMCYFSLDPKHIERLEPGQRPRFPMSPTLCFGERGTIAVGAAGGWAIPQVIVQTLWKALAFGMGIRQAVASPRFVLRYRYNSIPYAPGTVVDVEPQIPARTIAALRARGHIVSEQEPIADPRPGRSRSFGAVNALVSKGRSLQGGPEPRRDGYAASA